MCFSATASFVASGVLVGASIVTFSSLKKQPTKLFAVIPLLFAVQQAVEGFQWIVLGHGSPSMPLAYAFVFFAYLFWPVFLPLASLQAESDPTRRKLIMVCFGAGIFTALVLGYSMIIHPLIVSVPGQCISYRIDTIYQMPLKLLLPVTYLVSVIGGGLLVRRFWIQMFGALGLVGLAVSYIGFTLAYQSVWCFFAAAISLCIIMELRSVKTSAPKK